VPLPKEHGRPQGCRNQCAQSNFWSEVFSEFVNVFSPYLLRELA
jgi:hypothetical protein